MKSFKFTFLIISILLPLNTIAHPVSFSDSVGLMGYNSPKLTHNQLNYSFKHWFALGVHHLRRPTQNTSASLVSTNFLIKRWNSSSFQANIYSVLGLGHSNLSRFDRVSGLGIIQFDIEDRDYYFLAKHQNIFTEEGIDLEQTTLRVGFTPYVEKFNGFHSWFIFEWQTTAFFKENQTSDITPFLRFFYQNLLFEIGQSFNGNTKFNYISHF